MRSEVDKN